MNGILKITNGTESVSFLVTVNGWQVEDELILQPPQLKGGGVWSESVFGTGRQPVMRQYGNVIDNFPLVLSAETMDQIGAKIITANRLLEQASKYWTEEYTVTPVWIELRGKQETNTRYAYVYDYIPVNLISPFVPPFSAGVDDTAIDSISITVEHGIWRGSAPDARECLRLTSYGYKAGFYAEDFLLNAGNNLAELGSFHEFLTNYLPGWAANFGFIAGSTWSSGIRYTGINIPATATILNAHVRFIARADRPNLCIAKVEGELAINSVAFTDEADFVGRVRTATTIPWNPVPAWVTGNTYDTPDLATVLSEIIAQPGWASGNALTIFVDDDGSGPGANVHRDFKYPDATLHVEWLDADGETIHVGQVAPSCDQNNFFVPYYTRSYITHIFSYDASAGTFDPNNYAFIDVGTILPAVVGVGDCIYIGCASAMDVRGVFNNLILTLSNNGNANHVWEYWNGAAWALIAPTAVEDPVGTFLNGVAGSSVVKVVWENSANWATTAVNGITAWWVRVRCTAVGTPPVTSKAIYTVTWPWVDYAASEIGGDWLSLVDFNLSLFQSGSGTGVDHVLLFKRAQWRGLNFTPYLGVIGANLPTWAVYGSGGVGVVTLITNDPIYPCGGYDSHVFAGAGTSYARWNIDSANTAEYHGRFRMFVRFEITAGAAADLSASGEVLVGGLNSSITNGLIQTAYSTTQVQILDLGTFNVPKEYTYWGALYFKVNFTAAAALTLRVIDIGLMPVDEACIEIIDETTTIEFDTSLDILSHFSSKAKASPVSELLNYYTAGLLKIYRMRTILMDVLKVSPNEAGRWYILAYNSQGGGAVRQMAMIVNVLAPQMYHVDHYLLMRGDQ